MTTPTDHPALSFAETVPSDPAIAAMLPAPGPNMERLIDILSLKRCHNSIGETKFVDQILRPFKPQAWLDPEDNSILAYTVTTDPGGSILWSCHIDTVHNLVEDSKQLVLHDEGTGLIYKQDGKPLGADDGAGVWLLLEMIEANVPGTYIFHRGEEKGGIGSRGMAKHHNKWLETFTHAIAFDRRDTCSIITRQSRGRCCSDDFAKHFANKLSDDAFKLAPDPTGTFTDTANYIGLIGECTNVSIGYHNEHGGSELLDVEYLLWLRGRLLSINPSHISCVNIRKPGEIDPADTARYSPGVGRYYGNTQHGFGFDDEPWGGFGYERGTVPATKKRAATPKLAAVPTTAPKTRRVPAPRTAEAVLNMKAFELRDYVKGAQTWDLVDLITELAMQIEFPDTSKGRRK